MPNKGKALSVVRKPVLNPSHRGVIDDAEKASLLVTGDQLYAALRVLKRDTDNGLIWQLAEKKNKDYTIYGEDCFLELLTARENISGDFQALE